MGAVDSPPAKLRHPAGLYILFFTEMWERFGFYCMEAVFVFYMQVSQYEFLRNYSSRIYGLYLAGVYFTPFFGGLLAEWRFGYFLSIILGGFCMAGGYGLLSLEPALCFGLGLAAIIIGNGLFKPNISSLVGKLYPQGDKRVDAAFTIFYMGINVGALMAPIIAGMIGILMADSRPVEVATSHFALLGCEPGLPIASLCAASEGVSSVSRAGYLWVFSIAAAGMIVGEIIFLLGRPFVKVVRPADTTVSADEVPADLQRRRQLALVVFFTINVLFWMAFKQRANSINNWIEKRTDLSVPYWLETTLSTLGIERLFLQNGRIAKELYQALNPFFVILLSPLLVLFWLALRKLRLDVSTPAKLVLGFALTSGAFAIMWRTAATTPPDVRAPSYILVAFYAVLTLGELCLSPMGLSLVSKLAPVKTRAIWMGLFFVSTSVGGYLAGEVRQLVKHWEFADFFLLLTCSSLFAGLLMLAAYPLIRAALRPGSVAIVGATRAMTREFTLTDVANDIWLDSFKLGNQTLPLATPHVWSIRKRTLRGGLRDGVDMIDVNNGALSFSVLPTRGMGLWRGAYRGIGLGWQAPRLGPVHPKFVDPQDRGGIGWLAGFDEWLCRCGLSSVGPPGDDAGMALTLHGRIANQPAHKVVVAVQTESPFAISIHGEVEEGGLFYPRLRLTTTYTTIPGSNRLDVRDEVVNLGGSPAEMQLLYHCNLGPPLLGAGSRVRVPVRELWPLTEQAAKALDRREVYESPTPGFAEEVFCVFPQADDQGKTLALLHDAAAARAMVLRWDVQSLPCFTFWKNTAAIEDGYVTGIEPATCFPRFKAKEREAGRVMSLAPGSRWHAEWSIEVADDPAAVQSFVAEIDAIQSRKPAIIHKTPLA